MPHVADKFASEGTRFFDAGLIGTASPRRIGSLWLARFRTTA
jgi:hypothetical protein